MYRKYNIAIHISEGTYLQNDELLQIFSCSISEPSNWVDYGTTRERGLTFLDKNGKELDSIVFEHQPYFNSIKEKSISEKEEIRELIFQVLLKHYQLRPTDITITVSEAMAF